MTLSSSPPPPDDESKQPGLSIVIVGPCGAGKSTLAANLMELGYQARQIAQEHSFVPDMWQQLSNPDVLIFLEASFESCSQRKAFHWSLADYEEQMRRLQHAHQHCHIQINTDDLTPKEILTQVLTELT
ncbi:MAG: hypothetical protein PVF49_00945 [Anaerolineales bacterium]|jgi:shikimate kinase